MAADNFQQRNDKGRMRKPVVEKKRRDRINNSIEQLRLLLKDELKGRPLSSRLEKADVLEMTVTYLKSKTHGQSYTDGFTRCLGETARFLSAHKQSKDKPAVDQPKCLPHKPISGLTSVCVSDKSPKCIATNGTPLWRPW